MKRASFALTKLQLLDGSKSVTRRLGWLNLKAGDRLLAVSKGMGLKAGEKPDIYGPIEVVSVRRERLDAIDADDCRREGFPELSPPEFVEFFCKANRGCKPDTLVTRIEFKRITRNREPLTEREVSDVLYRLEKGDSIVKSKVVTHPKAGKSEGGHTCHSVLVADPPWHFSDKLPGKKRGASKHYRVLKLNDVRAFPLPPLADDCWLFLWVVASQLAEGLSVVSAWGFDPPVANIAWVKMTKDGKRVRMGMGRSVRNCHEICLIAKKGKPERLSAAVESVIFAPRGEHSAKPEEFYQLVDKLVPGPTVELFARRQWPGWLCLGDEMPEVAA